MKFIAETTFVAKSQKELLNALRGLAAFIVICFHVGEAFATNAIDQPCNHGYLAVDFFFLLSGFVIGYSYDDRWQFMTQQQFFIRRLKRLHPLLIVGAIIGFATFLAAGSLTWNGEHKTIGLVMIALLMNVFLIPIISGMKADVRGNGEMYPLNGPTWSLFFEYIGNILYALLLRKLSNRYLLIVVAVSAVSVISFALNNGSGTYSMGVGWSLADNNFIGGLIRMTFSYSMGMLIARYYNNINNVRARLLPLFTSIICCVSLIVLMVMPYVGGSQPSILNGIYDSFCIIVAFPLIVIIASKADIKGTTLTKACRLVGDMSYPFYIVHYPFMYLFYAHVWNNGLSFAQSWHWALAVILTAAILAFILRKVRL